MSGMGSLSADLTVISAPPQMIGGGGVWSPRRPQRPAVIMAGQAIAYLPTITTTIALPRIILPAFARADIAWRFWTEHPVVISDASGGARLPFSGGETMCIMTLQIGGTIGLWEVLRAREERVERELLALLV